jgi:CheY-like chemotaxis protein
MKCQGAVLLTGAVQVQRYPYGRELTAKRIEVWEDWHLDRAVARVRSAPPDVVTIFAPDESYAIEVATRLTREVSTPRIPLLLVTDQAPHQSPPALQSTSWDGRLVNPVKPSLLASEICRLITLARVDAAFARLARTREQVQSLVDAADRSVAQAAKAIERSRRIRDAAARRRSRPEG